MEQKKVKIIEIVTVSKLTPIFKEGMEANAIQMVNFNFENGDECGYNLIAQKGLYEIGSKAIYIQPDYCLSEIKLFESFVAPGGDPKKSRLGKNNRIRAIKFNFSLEGTTDPIYSYGILMPFEEAQAYLNFTEEQMYATDLADALCVTKYEEPETGGSGLTAGDFPSFMYKTDEDRMENKKSAVIRAIENGEEFGITIKHDGSSHTTYFKVIDGALKPGVCSRSQEKKMEQKYVTAYFDADGNEYGRYIHPETKVKGWYCHATSTFKTEDEVVDFTPVKQEVKDSWVDLAFSTGLIENGMKYCEENSLELAFRGEIYGQGLKGSGNKLNPDANEKQTLRLFGVDDLSKGYAERINYSSPHNLVAISQALGMECTVPLVVKPTSYEELCEICENIFKEEKAKGRVIEGVVVRTHYTNNISVKYMNAEYDSKK